MALLDCNCASADPRAFACSFGPHSRAILLKRARKCPRIRPLSRRPLNAVHAPSWVFHSFAGYGLINVAPCSPEQSARHGFIFNNSIAALFERFLRQQRCGRPGSSTVALAERTANTLCAEAICDVPI